MPEFIQSSCGIIKNSAPFLALFTLGASLGTYNVKLANYDYREIFFLVSMKNLIHPFIAYLIGAFIFKLPTFWLGSLVLMAAMPTAKNLFVFATKYEVGIKKANIIVVLTTIISITIISIILFSYNMLQ